MRLEYRLACAVCLRCKQERWGHTEANALAHTRDNALSCKSIARAHARAHARARARALIDRERESDCNNLPLQQLGLQASRAVERRCVASLQVKVKIAMKPCALRTHLLQLLHHPPHFLAQLRAHLYIMCMMCCTYISIRHYCVYIYTHTHTYIYTQRYREK